MYIQPQNKMLIRVMSTPNELSTFINAKGIMVMLVL